MGRVDEREHAVGAEFVEAKRDLERPIDALLDD